MRTAPCFLALVLSLAACNTLDDFGVPPAPVDDMGDDDDAAQEPCGGIPPLPPRVGGWQPCDPGEIGPQRSRLGCYVPTEATVGTCTLSCETQLDCSDLWTHQQHVPDCDLSRQVCILPCLDGGCPDGMTCSQVQARAICTWEQ